MATGKVTSGLAQYYGNYSKLTWNTNVVTSSGTSDVQATIYTLDNLVILNVGFRLKTGLTGSTGYVADLPADLKPVGIFRTMMVTSLTSDSHDKEGVALPLQRYGGVSNDSPTSHPNGYVYINSPSVSSNTRYFFGVIVYVREM